MEIVRWLLESGRDVDARAAVDREGFGGLAVATPQISA